MDKLPRFNQDLLDWEANNRELQWYIGGYTYEGKLDEAKLSVYADHPLQQSFRERTGKDLLSYRLKSYVEQVAYWEAFWGETSLGSGSLRRCQNICTGHATAAIYAAKLTCFKSGDRVRFCREWQDPKTVVTHISGTVVRVEESGAQTEYSVRVLVEWGGLYPPAVCAVENLIHERDVT